MFTKHFRLLFVLLSLVMLVVNPVLSQDNRSYYVDSFADISRLGIVARPGETVQISLRNCQREGEICSIVLTAGGGRGGIQLQSSGTIVCSASYRNALGVEIATLTNNQSTTFYNQYGNSPFSWNSLPNATTTTGVGASWGTIVGTITPGTGVQSSIGFSKVEGTLYYLGGSSNRIVNIRFPSHGSGYICEAA